VECRIEARYLRERRIQSRHFVDSAKLGRQMIGSKRDDVFDQGTNLCIDSHGRQQGQATMHEPVSDGLNRMK